MAAIGQEFLEVGGIENRDLNDAIRPLQIEDGVQNATRQIGVGRTGKHNI